MNLKTFLSFTIFLCSNLLSSQINAALVHNSTLLIGAQSENYWSYDLNSDSIFSEDERTNIEAGIDGGIILGATQGIGYIDTPWNYNGGTGYHYTHTPITIISDDNSGNIELDIYGLRIWWEGEYYTLDSVANPTGNLICTNTCENGDSFVLEVLASLPCADCYLRNRHDYTLHMEGTISSVPIPATLWLFSSGLISLFGFFRRIHLNIKNT